MKASFAESVTEVAATVGAISSMRLTAEMEPEPTGAAATVGAISSRRLTAEMEPAPTLLTATAAISELVFIGDGGLDLTVVAGE